MDIEVTPRSYLTAAAVSFVLLVLGFAFSQFLLGELILFKSDELTLLLGLNLRQWIIGTVFSFLVLNMFAGLGVVLVLYAIKRPSFLGFIMFPVIFMGGMQIFGAIFRDGFSLEELVWPVLFTVLMLIVFSAFYLIAFKRVEAEAADV